MPIAATPSERKKVCAYGIAGLALTVLFLLVLYLLDQNLHKKFDSISSLNQQGYRGALVGPKKPGEIRVFLLGGSTALGYGVYPDETIASYLEQSLNSKDDKDALYSVINLGFNNTGAATFVSDLTHYRYLDADIVIFYTGYGDLAPNPNLGRHESVVFRLTGYYPVFPLIVSEKAKLLRYHSWGQWSQYKSVFNDAGKTQVSSQVLAQASPVKKDWSEYCERIRRAINLALGQNKLIIVVTEPYFSVEHFDQQESVRLMLEREYKDNESVVYVNLGNLLDPADKEFAFDAVHLNAAGNRAVAEKLAEVVQNSRGKN